jgi:hypothetical protein
MKRCDHRALIPGIIVTSVISAILLVVVVSLLLPRCKRRVSRSRSLKSKIRNGTFSIDPILPRYSNLIATPPPTRKRSQENSVIVLRSEADVFGTPIASYSIAGSPHTLRPHSYDDQTLRYPPPSPRLITEAGTSTIVQTTGDADVDTLLRLQVAQLWENGVLSQTTELPPAYRDSEIT